MYETSEVAFIAKEISDISLSSIIASDRPKFGSVPVPAEIGTGTEIPVLVLAMSETLVPAEIWVQMLAKIFA